MFPLTQVIQVENVWKVRERESDGEREIETVRKGQRKEGGRRERKKRGARI